MREILTLQLGQLANYVGTHYWNTQDAYFSYNDDASVEFDHDTLFRAGSTLKGTETYTPRALIFDLKGAFGSLHKYNKLYESAGADDAVAWEHGVQQASAEAADHPYQQQLQLAEQGQAPLQDASEQLDQTVSSWADFNRVYYHPRSMTTVASHTVDNPLTPFDTIAIGRKAYKDLDKDLDIYDGLVRHYVEECDQLQGFQLFADIDSAFAGFAEQLLDDIADDFPKTSILTFGMMKAENKRPVSTLNRFFGIPRLTQASSLFVPLYTPTSSRIQIDGLAPYIHPNCASVYHTSAVLSAAIETATSCFRLKRDAMTISGLEGLLNWRRETRLASLGVALPLPISSYGYSASLSSNRPLLPLMDLSLQSSLSKPEHVFGECITLRGLMNQGDKEKYVNEVCKPFKDELDQLQHRVMVDTAYPLPDSYPRFFSSLLDEEGKIYDATPGTTTRPHHVPMLTHLSTNSNTKQMLAAENAAANGVALKDIMTFMQGDMGMTHDDHLQAKEDMINLMDCYSTDQEMM
ncbi:tubulin domain-containing protein [Gongronella butleri]|nr:tubulin domain-containing protein [Gongronella butleri]